MDTYFFECWVVHHASDASIRLRMFLPGKGDTPAITWIYGAPGMTQVINGDDHLIHVNTTASRLLIHSPVKFWTITLYANIY